MHGLNGPGANVPGSNVHGLDLHGAGLGLRRELIPALQAGVPPAIGFFEIAPENWLDLGGSGGKSLRFFSERFPLVCHGLSLSLGGPGPLDEVLLGRIGRFDQLELIALGGHPTILRPLSRPACNCFSTLDRSTALRDCLPEDRARRWYLPCTFRPHDG